MHAQFDLFKLTLSYLTVNIFYYFTFEKRILIGKFMKNPRKILKFAKSSQNTHQEYS